MYILANSTNNGTELDQAGFKIRFIANKDQALQSYNQQVQDDLDDRDYEGSYQTALFEVTSLAALDGFKLTYDENGFNDPKVEGVTLLQQEDFSPSMQEDDEENEEEEGE